MSYNDNVDNNKKITQIYNKFANFSGAFPSSTNRVEKKKTSGTFI